MVWCRCCLTRNLVRTSIQCRDGGNAALLRTSRVEKECCFLVLGLSLSSRLSQDQPHPNQDGRTHVSRTVRASWLQLHCMAPSGVYINAVFVPQRRSCAKGENAQSGTLSRHALRLPRPSFLCCCCCCCPSPGSRSKSWLQQQSCIASYMTCNIWAASIDCQAAKQKCAFQPHWHTTYM